MFQPLGKFEPLCQIRRCSWVEPTFKQPTPQNQAHQALGKTQTPYTQQPFVGTAHATR